MARHYWQNDEEAQTFKELDSRFRRTFLITLKKSGYEEDRALAEGARQTSIMSDLPIESRLAGLNLSSDAPSFIDSGKVRIPSELVIDHRSIRMTGDGENTFSGTEEENIAAAEHVIKMRRLWALPIPTMEALEASENSQGSRTRQSSKNKREKARRRRRKIKAEKSKATDDDAGTTGGSNTG
uniref:Uncharacterized protein n=2 Tax=Cryptococcus bacillisporus CA1280 TaxID=1296109 RepID=A0A0D0VJW9_CRYGA|nr:hypothetical protein I312_02833 [Cryptococcus bacillisporus CA1280]